MMYNIRTGFQAPKKYPCVIIVEMQHISVTGMPTAEQLRCSALGQAMLWPCWCLQVLSMSEGGKPVQTSKHMMSRVHVISNFNKHLRCNACIRSCSCQPDRVEPGYKSCSPWTTSHDTCWYRSSICIAVPLGRASEVNNTHHVKRLRGHM